MRHVAVIAVAALLLAGCSETDFAAEAIMAAVEASDTDVGERLETQLQSVRTVPTSGLLRGRLGMAYDINGFRHEAIATYGQARSLDPKDFRWAYFAAHLVAEDGRRLRTGPGTPGACAPGRRRAAPAAPSTSST